MLSLTTDTYSVSFRSKRTSQSWKSFQVTLDTNTSMEISTWCSSKKVPRTLCPLARSIFPETEVVKTFNERRKFFLPQDRKLMAILNSAFCLWYLFSASRKPLNSQSRRKFFGSRQYHPGPKFSCAFRIRLDRRGHPVWVRRLLPHILYIKSVLW